MNDETLSRLQLDILKLERAIEEKKQIMRVIGKEVKKLEVSA